MNDAKYPHIEETIGNQCLKEHDTHPFNVWQSEDERRTTLFLSRMEDYLAFVTLQTNRLRNKLRNPGTFIDTYNELGVGCFLLDKGFPSILKRR